MVLHFLKKQIYSLILKYTIKIDKNNSIAFVGKVVLGSALTRNIKKHAKYIIKLDERKINF